METTSTSLTDPADVWKLVGRFSAAFVLVAFTLWYIIRRDLPATVFFGLASIVFQTAALRLRRRLIVERAAAVLAREEETHHA